MKRAIISSKQCLIYILALLLLTIVSSTNLREQKNSSDKNEKNDGDLFFRPVKKWVLQSDGTVRVIAKFKNSEGRTAAIDASLSITQDLSEKYGIIGLSLRDEDTANKLLQNRNIVSVDLDFEMHALGNTHTRLAEDYTSFQFGEFEISPWGLSAIQSDLLEQNENGEQIKVCIVDTGYALGHPDLPDLDSGYLEGISTELGNWNDDIVGHGTHVAGTIAAMGNSLGVKGINPTGNSFGLIIAKGLGNDGVGSSSVVLAAVASCVEKGSKIINMSLGCNGLGFLISCYSETEEAFYRDLYDQGVLIVAAAGNSGNGVESYPASYNSVISVAAVDESNDVAVFSQHNAQVEIAAPGVNVLSTSTAIMIEVVSNGISLPCVPLENGPVASTVANIVNCRLGNDVCDASGKICLIERGVTTFAEKVMNCQENGGVGVIIYNNEIGDVLGTLSNTATTIPSVGVTQAVGITLITYIGRSVIKLTTDISNPALTYGTLDGTSMASPHIAGLTAKLWGHFSECSNVQIRNVLIKTALSIGEGCNRYSGYGLAQVKDAYDLLQAEGCNVGTVDTSDNAIGGCGQLGDDIECGTFFNDCTDNSDCCSNKCLRIFRVCAF
mmetsp:Transcript_20158/g.24706  ORF Transcript_20158/g.24706 Transcript_20158/m.24706 type:complete len:611 (-) Transcript_20158:298-2130(-)